MKNKIMMDKKSLIFVAGHKGMAGSSIYRALQEKGYSNILTIDRENLNLENQQETDGFFAKHKPEYVFLAAAKVGGIKANRDYPADFLYVNLAIQNNIFQSSRKYGVKKILFLGSSCIYPTNCPQPMKEEYLLSGPLETTNEGYAIAKIAGLKMGEYFYKQYGLKTISIMPCNLYGTNDSFDLNKAHVLASLVKRFVDAKENKLNEIVLWGSGEARREFMHVDDLGKIAVEIMEKYEKLDFINIGSGLDISIKELASLIAKEVGYKGEIKWDTSMPDGMMRKCLDLTRMHHLGLKAEIDLKTGIRGVIKEYKLKK